jgi:hypothetical protein
VIWTDASVNDFCNAWGLSTSVNIIGGDNTNLGRDDEISIFDGAGQLVDRLTYGDDISVPGSSYTKKVGGNPGSPSVLGTNDALNWVLSYVGDSNGSYADSAGDLGNPGHHTVPEPASIILVLIGAAGLIGLRRNSA